MSQMTEAQVLGAELERVLPDVPVWFDRDATFFSQLEKRPVEVVSGRDMRIPIELSPGGKSRQFNSDGGAMGRGSGPTYDKAVINTVDLLHAVEWSVKSQWVTDDKRKAVINNFRRLMANQMAQFRRDVDGLITSGSGDGVLGTVSASDINSGVAGYDVLTLDTDGFGAHLVRKGQDILIYSGDLLTARTVADATNKDVKYIDIPNKIIRLTTAAFTPVAATFVGDKIVFDGVSGTPPVSMNGVLYHHNDASVGTWLGFDRSATPEVRANSVNANSNPLALPFARLALNKIGDRLGIKERGQKTQAWTHPAQQQAYEEIGQGITQIFKQPKEEALDLYFNENMRLAGAPLKVSYNWNRKRIDFVDLDLWGRAELHKAGFYDVEGRKIFDLRHTDGGLLAAMIFYIVASFNTFVKTPAGCSYVKGLTVPTGY